MYELMKGVRVVEVAAYISAPAAGAILADWGADVIKVEPPGGDPFRIMHKDAVPAGVHNPRVELPNRGKRSVGIDLRQTEGIDLLYQLVKDADVFITSFMMPTLLHLKIDYDTLKKINKRLIFARSSSYGTRGPDAERPAFDLAATWARAGFIHRLTPPGAKEPAEYPGSIGDLSSGFALASGIAAALFKRERSGEATQVDVSLYHAGMWMMSQAIDVAPLGLAEQPGASSRSNPRTALRNSYRTRDDRWLVLNIVQPDQGLWKDLCEHVGHPDLAANPRFHDVPSRRENSRELVIALDEIFAERTLDEWRRTLATMRGIWAPALSAEEIAIDPQALENEYFATVVARDGTTFRSVSAPVQFGGETIGELRAMPKFAENTDEVLAELGLSDSAISKLRELSVIE